MQSSRSRVRSRTGHPRGLVKHDFTATGRDRGWFTDINQHQRAAEEWVYWCALIDAYTRRWSAGYSLTRSVPDG